MQAADHRTQLIYAANGSAELSVSADDGCTVYYTTDGSAPTTVNGNTVENGKITVNAPSGITKATTVTVKATAANSAGKSEATTIDLTFIPVSTDSIGTKVYECEAPISGKKFADYSYTGKIRVTTVNGKIKKVEDNGTDAGTKNSTYWKKLISGTMNSKSDLLGKWKDKTLADLISAKTVPNDTTYKTDAVSGATISTDSLKWALIEAMQGDPVSENDFEVLTPVAKYTSGASVVSGLYSSKRYVGLTIQADTSDTVRYTTDGTDPTAESEKLTGTSKNFYQTEKTTPEIQTIKLAAFDANSKRSHVVTAYLVFSKEYEEMPYEKLTKGTYEGIANGVTANVEIGAGNSLNIIRTITLDEETTKASSAFLDELLAHVYYEQDVSKVTPLAGYDTDAQQKVLDAIAAAVNPAKRAPKPVMIVDPIFDQSGQTYKTYTFEEPPSVTITDGIANAKIQYSYTDRNLSSTIVSRTDWTDYTDTLHPVFSSETGGNLYVFARASMDNGKTWSATQTITLRYDAKASSEE